MLSDGALLLTGLAFVSIVGGAWALHRRTVAAPAAPAQESSPKLKPDVSPEAKSLHKSNAGAPASADLATAQTADWIAAPEFLADASSRMLGGFGDSVVATPRPGGARATSGGISKSGIRTETHAVAPRPEPQIEATTGLSGTAKGNGQWADARTDGVFPRAAPALARTHDRDANPFSEPSLSKTANLGAGAQTRIETLVLRAALEDALEHLVEVYGEEYVDAFHARRIRRNVEPYRKMVAASDDPAIVQDGLRQATEAEEALKKVVTAVRQSVRAGQH